MIKNYTHYKKRVAERVNKNPSVPNVKITPQQVDKVLSYFMKNVILTLRNPQNEINFNGRFKITPLKRDLRYYLDKKAFKK